LPCRSPISEMRSVSNVRVVARRRPGRRPRRRSVEGIYFVVMMYLQKDH
jgi:hypothetical protein